MDPAYVHLLVNHFPIVLSVVAAGIVVLALFTGRRFLWQFALTCSALGGVAAVVANLTGEPASRAMRQRWYVERATIRAHEQAGDLAMWIATLTAVVAAYALWRMSRRPAPGASEFPLLLRILAFVGILASAGVMGWAGLQGGKIVHRAPALERAPAGTPASPAPQPGTMP